MTRSFPHLGFDPAPGEVERTRALARQLGDLHGELTVTVDELARIDSGYWKGEAAKAFVAHIDSDVTPLIKKAHDSFGRASEALTRWADQLHGFQDEADSLEREAAARQSAVDRARSALGSPAADDGVPHPAPGAAPDPAAAADRKRKQQAATEAGDALQAVRHRADELHARFTQAAVTISRDLDKAGDIAPDRPGLFSRMVHGVEGAWNDTVQWVQDHADLIKTIGDLLSDLTGILAVLAIITAPFEPLGAIFAAAAVVTSVAALVSHLIAKAAGADVSWMSIGFDALGAVPGIGAFAKGAKVVEGSVAAARAVELGEGFRGVTTIGRNFVGKAGELITNGKQITLFKNLTLEFGGIKTAGNIVSDGKMINRMQLISEQVYHNGQLIGTKGLKAITGGRVAVDAMSTTGRAIDAGLKLAPKLYSIPQHIGEAVHLGDRFDQAATSH
ncbi:putative T7SS-secreted protein [Streptomyces polygonati]|uniref:T7SS-secreted protein n=1 Tax=Streptomyces polygonati TaxID=1617087 RepID=A0ABV8HS43_9ACTN